MSPDVDSEATAEIMVAGIAAPLPESVLEQLQEVCRKPGWQVIVMLLNLIQEADVIRSIGSTDVKLETCCAAQGSYTLAEQLKELPAQVEQAIEDIIEDRQKTKTT